MKKFLIAAFTFSVTTAMAQVPEARLDSVVQAYAKAGKFNGSVMVAQKGKVLYQKGVGFRNADAKLMNDADGIYQIGSITKQFTAAIIMQLQQEKKLSVQDKLSKYFPGFVNGDKITIEHLLTHTSGLHNYTEDSTIMQSDVTKHYSSATMVSLIKAYPPDFEPGSKWNYSNSAYSMLGYIIEMVEKQPYESVVRKRILQPLGMTHSGFDFTNLKDAKKETGYFKKPTGLDPAPIVDSTIAFSAGALYSTLDDLMKWDRAIYTNKILSQDSWKAVFTPQQNKYGYGWNIDTLFGKRITAHSGGIHGFSSFILRVPEDELVIIALDNTGTGVSKLSRSLAAVVYNQEDKAAPPKASAGIDEKLLNKYVGEYELAPGFTITITQKGGQLFGQATGQGAFELFPEKPNLFFLKVVEAKVEFILDDKGAVTELVLYQNGQEPRGKKIR